MSTTRAAARFARPLMMAGRCVLFVGVGVLAAFHLFATDAQAIALGRIIGGALTLLGLLTCGFGLLVRAMNRAPRDLR